MKVIKVEKGHFVDLSRLNDDSIIVDAGACRGDVIAELRTHKETANCQIYAVEPGTSNMNIIIERKFDNVKLYQVALVAQDYEGQKVMFHETHGKPEWCYVEVGFEAKRRRRMPQTEYEVEVLRINDLPKQFKIDRIDYLKMDTEGVEHDLIRTMTPETAEMIKQWSFEFHPAEPNHKVSLQNMLKDLGFEIYEEGTYKEIFCGRP
jgi:FkbM family methyltransferase